MSTITHSADHPMDPGHRRAPVMTPQQQAQAVRQLHEHAQRRLQLGLQLFENARKQTQAHQAMADQLRKEQDALRLQLQEDMTRSLHSYDQWIGKVESDFADRLDQLDRRMSQLQEQWQSMSIRVQEMLKRAEALMDQARWISEAAVKFSRTPIAGPEQPLADRVKIAGLTPPGNPMSAPVPSPSSQAPSSSPAPVLAADAQAVEPAPEQTIENEGPLVRYLELLELLRTNPPRQQAA